MASLGGGPTSTPAYTTDLTSRVRTIDIQRGRGSERESWREGTCVLELDNRDGALDRLNTASPLYPNWKTNRRIQIGVRTNLLSRDTSDLENTGRTTNLDPDDVAYSAGAGTWGISTLEQAVRSTTNPIEGSASLRTLKAAGGTATVSTSPSGGGINGIPTVTPGAAAAFAGAWRSEGGGCSVALRIIWYTAAGAIISTTTGSTMALTANVTTRLSLSGRAPSTAAAFAVGYTLTVPAAVAVNADSFGGYYASAAPSTWSPGGPRYLFTGYIDSIELRWRNPNDAYAVVACSDIVKLLARAKVHTSPYRVEVAKDVSTLFTEYQMAEAAGATVMADTAPGRRDGAYVDSIDYAHGVTGLDPIVSADDRSSAAPFLGTHYTALGAAGTLPSASGWTVEQVFRLPARAVPLDGFAALLRLSSADTGPVDWVYVQMSAVTAPNIVRLSLAGFYNSGVTFSSPTYTLDTTEDCRTS